jgi:hypothetical protein
MNLFSNVVRPPKWENPVFRSITMLLVKPEQMSLEEKVPCLNQIYKIVLYIHSTSPDECNYKYLVSNPVLCSKYPLK